MTVKTVQHLEFDKCNQLNTFHKERLWCMIFIKQYYISMSFTLKIMNRMQSKLHPQSEVERVRWEEMGD